MCKKYEITGFPSILIFKENSHQHEVLPRSQKSVAGIEAALNLNAKMERRKLEEENGEEADEKADASPDDEENESTEDRKHAREDESKEDPDENDTDENKEEISPGDKEEEVSEDIDGDNKEVDLIKDEEQDSEDIDGNKKVMDSNEEGGEDSNERESDEKDSEEQSEDNPFIRPGSLMIPVKKKGAIAARGGPREMDKWKEIMRQRVEERQQFRRERRGFGRRGQFNKYSTVELKKGQISEGATDTMRAHMPGTQEFEARRQEIRKRVERVRNKHMRKRRHSDSSAGESSVGYPGRLGRLPYKKEVTKPRVVERLPVIKRFTHMSYEEELILDASLSFLQGLKFGIFTSNRPLTTEKRRALRDWLDLMAVSLPPEWGLHDIIDDLRDNFEHVSQSDKNMENVLLRHPPPRITWSKSCSKTAGGGFTCGFWKLLHIMAIGVAEHKGGQNLKDAKLIRPNAKVFSPLEAADTLRLYIGNFFTCDECKRHFIKQYDNCDRNRRCDRLIDDESSATDADWKELSKWLWEFHNEVNVRLLNEKAHRERMKKLQSSWRKELGPGAATMQEEISVLWPTLEQCILCFKEDGTWDEDAVFVFLEKTYWPDSSDDPRADRLLRFEGDDTPYGSRLTMFLVFVGMVLLYVMRKSLTKSGLQQTMLMAKNLKPKGTVGASKRSV